MAAGLGENPGVTEAIQIHLRSSKQGALSYCYFNDFGPWYRREVVFNRFEVKFDGFPDVRQRLISCFAFADTAGKTGDYRSVTALFTRLQDYQDPHSMSPRLVFRFPSMPSALSLSRASLWDLIPIIQYPVQLMEKVLHNSMSYWSDALTVKG